MAMVCEGSVQCLALAYVVNTFPPLSSRRILLYIYTRTSAGYTVWLGIFIPQAVKPTISFRLVKA